MDFIFYSFEVLMSTVEPPSMKLIRLLVYIADAAVVGESPNVKSKVELKSKVLGFFLLLLHVFRERNVDVLTQKTCFRH